MKKLVTVLLVLCLIFSGCGSASTETTATEPSTEVDPPMTFEQFQSKYKRESWSVLLSNPYPFLYEFKHMFDQEPEAWCPDMNVFEIAEKTNDEVKYEQDIVLFNKAFLFRFSIDNKYGMFSGTLSYYGDPSECFELYVGIFESLIANEGDPAELTVGTDIVSEADFRKALKDGAGKTDLEATLEASWKETKSGMWYNVWYNNIQEGWVYIF